MGQGYLINTTNGQGIELNGRPTASFWVVSNSGVTIAFEGTIDGQTWFAMLAYPIDSETPTTSLAPGGTGLYRVPAAGLFRVRARGTLFAVPGTSTAFVQATTSKDLFRVPLSTPILTPSQIGTLFAEWDGSLSASVSAWGDQSGFSRDWSQASAPNQPVYTAPPNGFFTFNGAGSNFGQAYRVQGSGYTWWGVMRTASAAANLNAYTQGNTLLGDTSGNLVGSLGVSSGKATFLYYDGAFSGVQATVLCNNNAWRLIGCRLDFATRVPTVFTDGTIQSFAPLANYNPSHGFNSMGVGYLGNGYFNGSIAHAGSYVGAISNFQISQLRAWATSRYGTP